MADVRLAVSVSEAIDELDADLQERVKSKLAEIGENPDRHVVNLQDREGYRVRIGNYRAIVDWDKTEGVLYVVEFGHRDGFYERN